MDQQQQRIRQLELERRKHVSNRDSLVARLAGAEQTFKRTRAPSDGHVVTELRNALHLAELQVAGVDEDIGRAQAPRRIQITGNRDHLEGERQRIETRRNFRHKQHAEQVERERQRHRGAPEAHIEIHLRNRFGSSERARREADEQDARLLADIDSQLALLDRREVNQQQPQPAA